MLLSILLTSIALVAAAPNCDTATTVTNAADASSLAAACPTFSGDLTVSSDFDDDSLVLDGLEEIQGSLLVEESNYMSEISSKSLGTITEEFSVSDAMILTTIDLPELASVDALTLLGLPNIQELSMLQTLTTLSTLNIQNTALYELEGFGIETISTIIISNNAYMDRMNLQPYNITGSLTFEANGRNIEFSMPNIEFGKNMTFRNCSSISMPSLTSADAMSFLSNSITAFEGAPLLKEVNGGLSFDSNQNMTRIALPELHTINGGFGLFNNTSLKTLDNLYSLETVDGDVSLDGTFTDVNFEALKEVTGDLIVESTNELSCDPFDKLVQNGVVAGTYNCTTESDVANAEASNDSEETPADTTGTSDSNGNPSDQQEDSNTSALSTGSKAGIGVGVGVGGCLVLAVVFLFLRRRRQPKQTLDSDPDSELLQEKDGMEIDGAAMLGNDVQKFELEQRTEELPAGIELQELPAKHGKVELGRSLSKDAPAGIESRHEMPANEDPPLDDIKKDYGSESPESTSRKVEN